MKLLWSHRSFGANIRFKSKELRKEYYLIAIQISKWKNTVSDQNIEYGTKNVEDICCNNWMNAMENNIIISLCVILTLGVSGIFCIWPMMWCCSNSLFHGYNRYIVYELSENRMERKYKLGLNMVLFRSWYLIFDWSIITDLSFVIFVISLLKRQRMKRSVPDELPLSCCSYQNWMKSITSQYISRVYMHLADDTEREYTHQRESRQHLLFLCSYSILSISGIYQHYQICLNIIIDCLFQRKQGIRAEYKYYNIYIHCRKYKAKDKE